MADSVIAEPEIAALQDEIERLRAELDDKDRMLDKMQTILNYRDHEIAALQQLRRLQHG